MEDFILPIAIFVPSIILVGVFVAIGVFVIKKSKPPEDAILTMGEIVEINKQVVQEEDNDGHYHTRTYYVPVFEVEVNGSPKRFNAKMMSRTDGDYAIGQNVMVYYDPKSGECLEEKDLEKTKKFGKILLIFSLFVMITAIASFIFNLSFIASIKD